MTFPDFTDKIKVRKGQRDDFMRLSDIITQRIIEMIESSDDNVAEIRRNELAEVFGCVPSQINYVLSSRFTPEHGYIIESRRGGGGYVKITRVRLSKSSAIMHIINSMGYEVDNATARIIIENCLHTGLINESAAALIEAAISGVVFKEIPVPLRASVRAAILKQMFLSLL